MLRSSRRDIIGITIIIIIGLSALLIFRSISRGSFDGVRNNYRDDWQDLLTQFKILKDNTRDILFPSRTQPYSVLQAQEKLKENIPQVFGSFRDADWEDFWKLIYAPQETDDYSSKYLPVRKRQLSIGEIEDILIADYPNVFGLFNNKMWNDFWALVFEN